MPADPTIPPSLDREQRLADRVTQLERQVRGIEQFLSGGAVQQIPVVSALPAAGRQGRLMMVAGTSKIWRDDGTNWVLESP